MRLDTRELRDLSSHLSFHSFHHSILLRQDSDPWYQICPRLPSIKAAQLSQAAQLSLLTASVLPNNNLRLISMPMPMTTMASSSRHIFLPVADQVLRYVCLISNRALQYLFPRADQAVIVAAVAAGAGAGEVGPATALDDHPDPAGQGPASRAVVEVHHRLSTFNQALQAWVCSRRLSKSLSKLINPPLYKLSHLQ